jgi:hypothetical protein
VNYYPGDHNKIKVLHHIKFYCRNTCILSLIVFFSKVTGQPAKYYLSDYYPESNIISGSIINLHDTVKDINSSDKQASERFYDSLKTKADKKPLTQELYKWLLKSSEKSKMDVHNVQPSEPSFILYNNSIVKSIRFKQVDVFGQSVTDTAGKASTWLQKTGNKLHIKTSRKILEKNLMIKTGEPLDAVELADNERIIRELPFIQDVRVLVIPDSPNADTVDIVIIVKDLWAVGFGAKFTDINSGEFGLWHRNIFGVGHETQHNIFWDVNGRTVLGYEGIYRISNIAGSFISGDLRYYKKDYTQSYRISMQRKFFTPNIKYAGGALIENKDTRMNIELLDTIMVDEPVHYSCYDGWFGRSFLLRSTKNLLTNSRTNLMFSGRFLRKVYFSGPAYTSESLYEYQDKTLILGSAAISKQGYFKSNLIYSFGRTEDIPFGLLLQIIAGIELGDFNNRPYLGASFSHGTYLWRIGYIYNRIELGGFYDNNAFEQSIFSFTGKYFTHLVNAGRFKYRLFANINYKTGINRFEDEFISIENNGGIPGLKSDQLKGTQKLTTDFELIAFTPYYLYGFRFAVFGSIDLGFIAPSDDFILSRRLYSGIGIGVRLRNERLVFNTFQIKFTLYPGAPAGADKEYISASGEKKLRPDYFFTSSPDIIHF